ncbi:MAG: anaerobic ribonucleoside-triphosphate reductase activating protein [Burkholderiales bacterium]|nr:anaerobic ribonucleoside-triphosphate reductase activating protein [Burkholderiales bacterium]
MSANISLNAPPNSTADTLKIGGMTPFSATDYPGMLAAVLFVQGCPWRCGYCHNPHLQPRTQESAIAWSDVLHFLYRRSELIDGVVFSGGEPAIDPALNEAIWSVRKMGFAIGLHSAGIYPRRLAEVLPWVDWVGLDIKAPFDRYEKITGIPDSGKLAQASIDAMLESGIDYEVRTTIHPTLLDEEEIVELASTLASMGVNNYALQLFRTQGCTDDKLKAATTAGYPSADTIARVSKLFPKFTFRKS